jgi:HD-like signal output (HDOD) protein
MQDVVTKAPPCSARELAKRSLSKLPPFSPVLNRLIATLSRENVSFAKTSDLIEKDPVLAGNILSLVNSPLYSRNGNVSSVRHAVSLLGVTKLRNAALGMSVTNLWGKMKAPAGWSMPHFNQHSLATAILCDLLSQEAETVYPEGAFVAGLLHDLGLLLLAMSGIGFAGEYSPAELSAEALNCWNLPLEIQNAVRYHDRPHADPANSANKIPLSHIVSAADIYINQIGLQIPGAPVREEVPEPFGGLGLDMLLPRILEEFHNEFEALRAVL